MIKKWWKKKTKEQKKWFLIKLISSSIFLVLGLIFGVVALYAYGWNFKEFITNPTVDLILLIIFALIIFSWTNKIERRE